MSEHHKFNYLEFPSKDLPQTKAFFESAFGWTFQDFGPDYSSFEKQGLDGGFYRSDLTSRTEKGAALAILFSDDLEQTLELVKNAGGEILKNVFEFPGGRRFHFAEPGGNEFAVWSDK
jgi:predicted enzyme related to lactoylglutathione lyase